MMDTGKATDRHGNVYEVTKFSDTEFAIRSSLKGSSRFTRKLNNLIRRTHAVVARTGHSNFVAVKMPSAKVADATAQQVADYFARE